MAISGSLALTFENRDKPKLSGSLPEPALGSIAEDLLPKSIQSVNWHDLVERIRAGDGSGAEDLSRLFGSGVRYYLCRQLGDLELDDRVHKTLMILVLAIQRGELPEPDRLTGFVRTVVRRRVTAYTDAVAHIRHTSIMWTRVIASRNPTITRNSWQVRPKGYVHTPDFEEPLRS